MTNLFNKVNMLIVALGLTLSLGVVAASTNSLALAQSTTDINSSTCEGINLATGSTGDDCTKDANSNDPTDSFSNIITNVINILSILVGAISVIMLIIGGFRYIISNGDANSTKAAKDTIMYALVGLIIVLFAQVIVRFVWTNATKSTNTTGQTSFSSKDV